jgi:hypothetical protein
MTALPYGMGKKGDDTLVNLTYSHRPFSYQKLLKNVILNPDEGVGEKSVSGLAQ